MSETKRWLANDLRRTNGASGEVLIAGGGDFVVVLASDYDQELAEAAALLHKTVNEKNDRIEALALELRLAKSATAYNGEMLDKERARAEALRKSLEVVLDDLMYKDHKRVIDCARAALTPKEPSE